jgi:hypothetical protein
VLLLPLLLSLFLTGQAIAAAEQLPVDHCALLNTVTHHRGRCRCCCLILQGKPSPLLSSFRLSYYTLLNPVTHAAAAAAAAAAA